MSVEDLSNAIALLSSGNYTVERRAANTLTNGRVVHGAITSIAIVALIEPATGNDVQFLPEGIRADETVTIFTSTKLLTADDSAQVSDRVLYKAKKYEVTSVEDLSELGNFYRVTAVRGAQ